MLTRRKFIQSFAGAVASVSIGMKLSQGMPELTQPSFDLVPENIKFKATEYMMPSWVDWRGAYGSPVGMGVRVDNV